MRRAFLGSRGELEPAAIAERSGCRDGEAQLVACARRLAPLEVLAAYEQGRLTFRRLWRACEYAGDPSRQRAVAEVA